MPREVIIEEDGWAPIFKWFWRVEGERGGLENPLGRHGAYPARWIARLAGWWQTR